ncbi:hypothetical protein LF1_44110 [Rubripirellula obstinata]|uniref:Uncharacterized protein n=1 Tax=Rubripirellula obstinata TaxID=406547 RepID=A0A5B1CQD8_9BACT|nr:hypothetical protein LF1_44110 [Rubripirellula obstinata]
MITKWNTSSYVPGLSPDFINDVLTFYQPWKATP